MSDLQKYGIALEFQKFKKTLDQVKKATTNFNKMQETAMKRQIALQKQLNKLKSYQPKAQGGSGSVPTGRPTVRPKPKPVDNFVGPQIDKNTQAFLTKQAKMRTREANKAAAAQARRVSQLEKAKEAIRTSVFMQRKATTESEKSAQAAIRAAMATEKTATGLRRAFTFHKNATAELRKQHFLMRRMQQSSEQFAGNFVSAFAVAAGGAAVTRIGQDFEAVNNTMLAVSADSKEAGENMSFVREEAYRLGLGLKESAKGFAKMAAARGALSLEDTKKAFSGVSEMSTLLGLSAEESNRAINALQQIDGLAS